MQDNYCGPNIGADYESNADVPAAAYKNSGIGVELGEEGLKEFCNIQVIAAKQEIRNG